VITGPRPCRPRGSSLVREWERPAGRAAAAAAGWVGTWVTDRGSAWLGMRTLLSCGHRARVDGHVPLPPVAVSRPWRAGSAVRGSGGGGLDRRAITAATAVVVPAVVATAVAVLVVVLVSVATVAAVATAGRARRRGVWWPGCGGRSVGVERRWGSRRTCTIHVELLQ
jgi:hypothetical protein